MTDDALPLAHLLDEDGVTLALGDGPPLPVVGSDVIAPEYDYVRAESAVMPDPDWVFTDRNGHEHRWALTERDDSTKPEALPTLQRRRELVQCDGSCGDLSGRCDGWTRWAYNCRACGALVEPGVVPDQRMRNTGVPIMRTLARYRFQIEGDPIPGHVWRSDDPPLRAVLADARTGATRSGTAHLTGKTVYKLGNVPRGWVEMRFDDEPSAMTS